MPIEKMIAVLPFLVWLWATWMLALTSLMSVNYDHKKTAFCNRFYDRDVTIWGKLILVSIFGGYYFFKKARIVFTFIWETSCVKNKGGKK